MEQQVTTPKQTPLDGVSSEESPGELQRYVQLLHKHKWLIMAVTAVVLSAVSVWTYSRARIYRATATVLVEKQAPKVLGKEVGEVVDLSSGTLWRNREYMETQRKVIKSRRVAKTVAERLNLVHNKTFWLPQGESALRKATMEKAVDRLLASVEARPLSKSDIISISFEHADPKLAAQLANAWAQAFLDHNVEYKSSSAVGAVKWLSNQLDDLKGQLENAEIALHDFRRKNNIVSVSLEDKQNLTARRIEKLNDALTQIRLQRMELEAKRKQALAARRKDLLNLPIGAVHDDETIRSLKSNYLDENRKYVALQERYLNKHPLVLEQQAKTQAAKSALEREIKNVLAAVESRYQEIRDNEAKLAGALQAAKEEAFDLNKREVTYRRLKRTQENTEKLYGVVLARMKESDLSARLRVNNIRVLDQALTPRIPVRPRVKLNLLVGAFLGLLLGLGLVVLIEALDTTVKSHEDVEQSPGLVYLGLMPKIPGTTNSRKGKRPEPKPDTDLIVHRNPKSPVAESCRSVRTNILFACPDSPARKFVVTSPGPREGKTTTAVSLAIAMAQHGSRVLIVDTDLRRPRLHKVFGVPSATGIASILLGDASIESVVKSTEVPSLYVLPCGPRPPNPAELCHSEKFRRLVDQLAEHFDRVILDSPPAMVVTDSVVLSTIVDGTVLVARSGMTTRASLRASAKQILDVGGRLLGCVLNDMDMQKRGYGAYRYRRYGYGRYGRYQYGGYGDHEEEPAT